MRGRRFVRVLGSAVEDAGREVCALASERRARRENAGLAAGDETAGEFGGDLARELPRRVARRVDGVAARGVEFAASVASPEQPDADGPDLGVVLCVDLPEYAVTTAAVADVRSVLDRDATSGDDGLADAAERALAVTPDAFVVAFPVGGRARVVPAAAVAGVAAAGEPVPETVPDAVYARSAGRFFEEFAEGFVGDRGIADAVEGPDDRDGLRAFQRETGVRDVLAVRVSTSAEPTDAKLTDFE
jgi:hypothetical protein